MRHAVLLPITVVALVIGLSPTAPAATKNRYKILHTFTGGKDGGMVASTLALGASGNPYGTTYSGGGWTKSGAPPAVE